MLRTIVTVILILSAVIYVICAFATIDRRSDAEQIRSLIEDASASVQARNLSGTMRCVSSEYKDSDGMNYDRLRILAVQAMRTEIKYTVSTGIKDIRVNGKKAEVDVHVLVKSTADSGNLYDRDIMLTFQKERGRHAMLIPVNVWRLRYAKSMGLANYDF